MPKIIDHERMREDLLARSFALFAARGFHAVTMRDLARELGVSTGTLYHYFTGKTDLYAQMLRTLVTRDVGRFIGNIRAGMSVQARLRVVIDYITAHEAYFRDLLFLLFDFLRYSRAVPPDSAEAAEVAKTHNVFRELFTTYRDAIQQHAGLPIAGFGHVLMGVIIGTLVQRIVEPAGESLADNLSCLNALLNEA